ncbi:MAG: bacteriohemerythrin [Bacteroidetes bacterium]|nr:bacteriohemerythrin [Bacteroidota bacterium]
MLTNISPEPLSWKEEYNVDIGLLDKQHKKFLEIFNLLKKAINEGVCERNISDVFFSLVYYAEHHLIQEEIYFKNYKYPNFNLHKEAHNHFINRIIKFREDFEEGKEDVCVEMYYFLEEWFNNHILKYDKEAVEFFVKKGVT